MRFAIFGLLVSLVVSWEHIITLSDENYPVHLNTWLEQSQEKKAKTMLILGGVRAGEANMSLAKEIIKLSDTIYRQTTVCKIDCQFEQATCNKLFGDYRDFPALLYLRDGKVWRFSGQKETFTQEYFLEYLSGENYLQFSEMHHDDSRVWINEVMGQEGSLVSRLSTAYQNRFEKWIESTSKTYFNKLGLSHWDQNAKGMLTVFAVVGPFCIFFGCFIAWIMTYVIDAYSYRQYQQTLDQLIQADQSLTSRIEELKQKKTN